MAALLAIGQTSYAEPVRAAHRDLARFENAAHYRYLVRPQAWTDKDWGHFLPALVGHLNQLSRSAVLYPRGTADVSASGKLLRVNVHKLGYAKAWDRLTDPYFTEQQEQWVTWPGGVWPYGKREYKAAGSFQYQVKAKAAPAQILMDGPEEAKLLNDMIYWTGSKAPLVRADWFHNQTIASNNRDPGYPEFLGFKDQKEFQALGGFDEKTAKGFRFEARDATSDSGVATSKVRAFARWDALGGGYWKTLDFKVPKGEKHPLRLMGREVEKVHDASEDYIPLPSGLWAMGAFDRQGKNQRVVPADVAGDSESRSTNKQIEVPLGCIRCHNDGGLKDVDPFFKNTLQPPLKGVVYDEKTQQELEQQYIRDIQGAIADDRLRYERAIKTASGLTSKEFAKRTAELWERYEDAKVNAAYAAAEFGMEEDEFRRKLLVVIKAGYPPVDPVMGSLVQKGTRLGIREWEEIAGQTYSVIRGVK